jgi:hypothetical protein
MSQAIGHFYKACAIFAHRLRLLPSLTPVFSFQFDRPFDCRGRSKLPPIPHFGDLGPCELEIDGYFWVHLADFSAGLLLTAVASCAIKCRRESTNEFDRIINPDKMPLYHANDSFWLMME